MKYLFSLLFIILSHYTYSQTAIGSNGNSQTLIDLKDNYATYIGLQPKSEGVIGSPFLFDELKNARISMITGKVHDNVLVNILSERDELYVQIKPNNIVVPEISYIESILIKDDSTVFQPFQLNNRRVYVQHLLEINGKDYIAYKEKKFVKATVGGAYNTGSKFDEYKEVISYFYIQDEEILEIKKNNSGLKLLAGENWEEARKFVKEKNIDFTDTDEIVQLILFIENL